MPAIARIKAADIGPSSLGYSFRSGAAAVIIEDEPVVQQIWEALTLNPAILPWSSSLHDLSANMAPHDDLTEALGDVFYFKPGRHLYIARKLEIVRTAGEVNGLSVRPDCFRNQGGCWRMTADVQEKCWGFAARILDALGPLSAQEGDPLSSFRTVVQQLKYHETVAGHEALIRMMRNSLGGWARLGYSIDRRREEMQGALARRGVSDAAALLSFLPFVGPLFDQFNVRARDGNGFSSLPEGYSLLVKAHVDSRYFSALCGQRHNLRTEIFVDGCWMPLPVNYRDIVILPGSRAVIAYGIAPTVHRVLQAFENPDDDADPRLRNMTLLLGAK